VPGITRKIGQVRKLPEKGTVCNPNPLAETGLEDAKPTPDHFTRSIALARARFSMREKQRHVTSFDEFFGKTSDEEFFQETAGVDPEDNEIGTLALGAEEVVKDFLHGRFRSVAC